MLVSTGRFWSKVDKQGEDECWTWIGSICSSGYGQMYVDGRLELSHRISWEMENGSIPKGMCVCHNCPGGDNRSCVNPNHLWLGTVGDNNRDIMHKGRWVPHNIRGESHGSAKLRGQDVREIRKLISGGMTQAWVAKRFGVARTTVRKIISGETWSHI